MKIRKIETDRYLILWNDKYYVVNGFTYQLLDMFDKKETLDQIKEKTKLSKFKIKRLYKQIEKHILSKEYYSDNLELEAPIKIQWKITNKCNLKCKHCYLGKLDNNELSNSKSMKIVDSIIASNVMEVTLSGGECLIYEGIEKIVEKLLSNDINVYMFTNGILLDKFIQKIDSKIKDKKSIMFYVSLDGLKKTHDNIRGKDTFDKTLDNIKYAIEKGYTIITNTVINNINYYDIMDMIIILKEIGVKDIQLSNLIVQGNATDKLKITLQQQMALKDELKKLYKEHPEYGYIYYSEVPDEENIRKVYSISNGKDAYIGDDNWKCTAGVARATIDADGKVYCCPFMNDSCIGDITLEKLPEIWHNIKRYQFLEKLAKNNSDGVCLVLKQDRKGVNKND